LLSKQTLLAGEALAGESGSLDLMNIDEEGGESFDLGLSSEDL
jgi:hypothetical protein